MITIYPKMYLHNKKFNFNKVFCLASQRPVCFIAPNGQRFYLSKQNPTLINDQVNTWRNRARRNSMFPPFCK